MTITKDKIKYSIASRNRMAKFSKEDLSKHMSALVQKRHARMSVEKKKKLGRFLATARKRVQKNAMSSM